MDKIHKLTNSPSHYCKMFIFMIEWKEYNNEGSFDL